MTESSQPFHHFYSAETSPRSVFRHAVEVVGYPLEIWRSRVLLWNFYRRDLLSRFHGSVMGIFWVLVQPIFLFAIYYAVFGVLFNRGSGDQRLFAIFLFSGILAFTMILETMSGGLSSVAANGNLVKKVAFPCEVLPVVPGLVASVVYVVGCGVLAIAGSVMGLVHFGWHTLAWPILVVLQLVFAVGVGLFFAQLFIFFRDLLHIWRIASQAWFFMTPNFWYVSMIVENDEISWAADYLVFNPAYVFVMANRQVFGIDLNLGDTRAIEFPMSLAENLGVAAVWAVVALIIGYASFMSRKHKFGDLV